MCLKLLDIAQRLPEALDPDAENRNNKDITSFPPALWDGPYATQGIIPYVLK